MTTLCKQTMIDSYNWTSFIPEIRGEEDYKYYTDLLAEDLKTLTDHQDGTGNYAEKFQDKVMTIYARQARCASPTITGPANFNNRRNGKAWDSRDKAVDEFNHWRNKYLNAVTRERTKVRRYLVKYTVKFVGRKSGAIGITYPIKHQVNSEIPLTLEQIRLKLYDDGFEHIGGITVIESESDEVLK